MGTLTLKRRMRALDAFAALAAADLQRIADALRAMDRRDRPDDLHALRVAVRHLRAVRWVFAPALPGAVAARWRIVLRDLMRATGPVRDWDVLIADTLQPALSRQPGDPVLLALLDWGSRHFAADGRRAVIRDRITGEIAEPLLIDRRSGRPLTDPAFERVYQNEPGQD